jgi:3-oxoacyl-[acyl-carrier-protein] synthase II
VREPVVVTGMGVLTPIGNGVESFHRGLAEGRDGIRELTAFDGSRHRFQRAGELKGFRPEEHFDAEELPHLSRCTQMVRVAAAEAITASGLELGREETRRIGVILGTDLGGMPALSSGYSSLHYPHRRTRSTGTEPWRSLLLDSFICSQADRLAYHYGFGGTTMVVSTACSAGLHAVGIGVEMIRMGLAEVMLVGGVDPLSEMPHAGFGVLRSLASGDIKPFHRHRDGTVLGEAAAFLVLEGATRARRRGAPEWCEIAGYGGSTDAYHMTRPDITGAGPARAMAAALEDAALTSERIGYVKAHGTATPTNDSIETRAIQRVFGDRPRVPVSSVKSMIGHSLGASGAVEAVASILALAHSFLPPTLHLDDADPECDLEHVDRPRSAPDLEAVMANAFGFGGNNASMVFRRAEAA